MVLTNDNDESRRVVESCYKRSKTTLNPIIDWTDADVWDYINANHIPVCSLYGEGLYRLGCIGCPMAARHGREREFLRWPVYKANYLKAFRRMLDRRRERGLLDGTWRMGTTPQDVYNWWMEYDLLPGQMSFEELEELEELEDASDEPI